MENKSSLENPPALIKDFKDNYHLDLTESDVSKIVGYFKKHKYGYQSSVPLKCKGDDCSFKDDCPFAEIGKFPSNKRCPLETVLLDGWISEYANNLGVDLSNPVDRKLISDLVVWELLEKRASEELGRDPAIVQENVVTVDNNGQEVKRKELNQIITFMEKCQRWKLKIMDALVATRKSKAGELKVKDPGSYASDLIEKARLLQKKAEDIKLKYAKDVTEKEEE